MRDPLLATAPDQHASVHASAGTGKTWLLVTRLLRLLLDGAAPASILAVTFTRKAAAEMLERLNERLAELATADDAQVDVALSAMGITATDALRKRARTLYETLLFEPRPIRATTFHAFCQEILQRFPVEAEVPPGFELQESEAELTEAAWDALYAEATLTPDGQQARALEQLFDACGGLSNTRQALNSFLSHRIDWWAYIQDQPAALGFAQHRAQELFDCDPDADLIAGFFTTTRCAELSEFAALLGKHDTKTNREHQQLLLQALALTEAQAGDSQQQRLESVTQVLLTANGEPRKRSTSKALEKSLGSSGSERFLELHNRLCNALLETRDQQARLASFALTCAWYQAGQRLLEHYQRIKREQRVLDFGDLEWNAYRLLNGSGQAHWVQYKLDARIDHFLIDEFQDTNPTQWRLLLPLLQELAAGITERKRSVFLVGDAKQSIYRFRRADARLLEAASDWLEEHLQAGRFSLEASRRSAPAIIDCVNRAFADGPLAAALPEFPPHSTHLTNLWGQVELLPPFTLPESVETIRTGLRNPLQEPRPTPADDLHLSEARSIAARIRRLIDAPTLIGPAEQARPLRYSDILILLRSRTHAGSYEQALREAGIPYLGAARGTLLDSLEVRDLEALLNTLIAPHNDLALAQVLRSPLFAATDQDLIQLAQATGTGWMERLLNLATEVATDSALVRAAQLLPRWQELVGRLPVHDLLDRIYHEGDVLARFDAAAIPALKPRVRANLIRFIELALEVDSGRYPSLPHFVDRLGDLRQRATDAPDDAPPESGGGDRVRFLTVHGAKGLESPVVFLADCGGGLRDRNAWQALVDWPAETDRPETFILIGRKQQRDRITQQLLECQQQAEQREDANLLYVALTRARQLLFVSAALSTDKADKGWYGLLRSQWDPQATLGPDESFIHCSGTPPTAATPTPAQTLPEVAIDPRLTQKLKLKPALIRIAPSRAGTHVASDAETDPDGRRRGIGIHRLLEWLTTPPLRTRTQLLAGLARELQCDAEDPELAEWLEEAQTVLQTPELAPLFNDSDYKKVYTEVPLQYYQGNALVDGVIDRLLITAISAHIIDYKSHNIDASQAEASAAAYREQLQLYVDGVRRLWPERQVRASILFTHCRVLVDI
ncbi:MAG: UvrD-helicase domain-containing protein [Gammaproteobacteria bacterium]|nr:UvrD-helicase domain-containing protein [Gammaproteobacteria bacterium]